MNHKTEKDSTKTKDHRCTNVQVNRHAGNFECSRMAGHPEPCRDPRTGRPWRDPEVPGTGSKKRRGANGSRSPTKKGSYFSTAPAAGASGSGPREKPFPRRLAEEQWAVDHRRVIAAGL